MNKDGGSYMQEVKCPNCGHTRTIRRMAGTEPTHDYYCDGCRKTVVPAPVEAEKELELALKTYRATGNTDGILAWRDAAVVAAIKLEFGLIQWDDNLSDSVKDGLYAGYIKDRLSQLGAKDEPIS